MIFKTINSWRDSCRLSRLCWTGWFCACCVGDPTSGMYLTPLIVRQQWMLQRMFYSIYSWKCSKMGSKRSTRPQERLPKCGPEPIQAQWSHSNITMIFEKTLQQTHEIQQLGRTSAGQMNTKQLKLGQREIMTFETVVAFCGELLAQTAPRRFCLSWSGRLCGCRLGGQMTMDSARFCGPMSSTLCAAWFGELHSAPEILLWWPTAASSLQVEHRLKTTPSKDM